MSKKKDRIEFFNDSKGKGLVKPKDDPVKLVDKYVGKKGKIGKDKKGQNRLMRGMCTHHKIGKKGLPRPAIYKSMDDTATCKICGCKMSTIPYDQKEIEKAINTIRYINEQHKFMAVATGVDKKMTYFFSEFGVLSAYYAKHSKNLMKVAEKQSKTKKKKKKNNTGSYEYGSWGDRRK